MRQIHSLEITGKVGDNVLHYTCNSPPLDVLRTHGITPVGEDYGLESREMVLIPLLVYDRHGYKVPQDRNSLKITTENLLSKLG